MKDRLLCHDRACHYSHNNKKCGFASTKYDSQPTIRSMTGRRSALNYSVEQGVLRLTGDRHVHRGVTTRVTLYIDTNMNISVYVPLEAVRCFICMDLTRATTLTAALSRSLRQIIERKCRGPVTAAVTVQHRLLTSACVQANRRRKDSSYFVPSRGRAYARNSMFISSETPKPRTFRHENTQMG